MVKGKKANIVRDMSLPLQILLDAFEKIAPTRFAESWDNVGLLVGDPTWAISRVLLTIDYTPAVAREARDLQCQAVVSYHPPIFESRKRILPGDGIFEAIRDGIALYSPHTALDVVPGGTNDVLCDLLGVEERRPLQPRAVSPLWTAGTVGMGRVAEIQSTPCTELLERIQNGLKLDSLLVGGSVNREIEKIAVCAGSGGRPLLDIALEQNVQLYLTGELRHHDVLHANKSGMTVICSLHSNSERVTLQHLQPRLEAELPGVDVLISKEDRDPLYVFRAKIQK